MSTPSEQIYLFGEVVPEDVTLYPLLWVFDMTLTGSMLFASICSLGLVFGYQKHLFWAFGFLYSLASSLLASVRAYIPAAGRLLVSVSSRQELRMALHDLRSRLFLSVVDSCLGRTLFSVASWYMSGESPVVMCRVFASFVIGVLAYSAVVVPVVESIWGFSEGFLSRASEQSGLCLSFLEWQMVYDRLNLRQWAPACRCVGEAAGLEVRSIIEDDWGLGDIFGEIHHFAFVLVAIVSAIVIAVVSFNTALDTRADRIRREKLRTETKLRDDARVRQEVVELRTSVDRYQVLLEAKDGFVAAVTEELRVAKQEVKSGRTEIESLKTAVRDNNQNVPRYSHRRDPKVKELRADLAQVVQSYDTVREELKRAKEDTSERERSLAADVAALEEQLASKEQVDENTLSENSSLSAALETRNRSLESQSQQLESIQNHLSAAVAREEESRRQRDTERQQAAAEYQILELYSQGLLSEKGLLMNQVNELTGQVQQISAEQQQTSGRFMALQEEYDMMVGDLFDKTEPDQGIDLAAQQATNLAQELEATKSAADTKITEIQASANLAERMLADARETMHALSTSYNTKLEEERQATADAQSRVEAMTFEASGFERNIGMAMRGAEQYRKQAEEARESAKAIESRLARYEPPEVVSTQEIPVRRTGQVNLAAALEEHQVTVAMQTTEIEQLKQKLAAEKAGASSFSDNNYDNQNKAMEQVARLRRDLEGEKRARVDDQLRWDRRTRELEEENRRLRISQSNASGGVFNHRGRGRYSVRLSVACLLLA